MTECLHQPLAYQRDFSAVHGMLMFFIHGPHACLFNNFIYLLLTVLGLPCCAGFLVAVRGGCSLVAVPGILTAVASLATELRLQGPPASVVAAHRLSCPSTCEIFPDRGSNPCPLHWQADSQPLDHKGSPSASILCQAWNSSWGST